MNRLRISAISYLNTAPLMWDFERGQVPDVFDISYTLPSACARELQAGTADIGIIPAAAYASIPGLQILPDVAIASRRAVRSILLVSKVPVEQIRTVALDTSSMTSVALTKVLLHNRLALAPTYISAPPNAEAMLEHNDAALLIGDPALQIDRARYITVDLAEEWIGMTGKPFVFAFWAVREAALADAPADLDLAGIFQRSRNHGLLPSSIDQIARQWAPRLGITESDVRGYISESIHYALDPECLEGLRLFYRYAADIGALPRIPELRFLEGRVMSR